MSRKIKVGTVLDKEILWQLKERAAKEGRSISDLINNALQKYFQNIKMHRDARRAAVEQLCSKPFHLSVRELNEILRENYFDQ